MARPPPANAELRIGDRLTLRSRVTRIWDEQGMTFVTLLVDGFAQSITVRRLELEATQRQAGEASDTDA
jgi:hypothetical protein